MSTIKEVELLSAKEIQRCIDWNEKELRLAEKRAAALKAMLSPFYHVRSIRTGTSVERAKWETELTK